MTYSNGLESPQFVGFYAAQFVVIDVHVFEW
jgi:hypothetical protein